MGFHARRTDDWASTGTSIVDPRYDNQKTAGACFRYRPSYSVSPFRHTPRSSCPATAGSLERQLAPPQIGRPDAICLQASFESTDRGYFVSTSCRICKSPDAPPQGSRHKFTPPTAPRAIERPPVALASICRDVLTFNQALSEKNNFSIDRAR